MKLDSHDFEKLVERTLEHYDQGAEDFWEGTRDHNVSQNIAALRSKSRANPLSRYSTSAAGQGARPKGVR